MKLKRFRKSDKKKIRIIVFTIACILLITGVILYRTFAMFETNEPFNVIHENMENVEFVFYINDVISKNVPENNGNYSLDTTKSSCTNGAMISWNDFTWRAEIENLNNTKTKCHLYFKDIYKESILRGAIPDLGNGRLIPITISNEEKPKDVNYQGTTVGGKVYKADITTNWYSYEQKRWANAVVLKDGVVDHYRPGEEIPEKDIESYFVWIPRYKYQLKENESTYDSYKTVTSRGEISDNSTLPKTGETSVYQITFETKEEQISKGNQQNQWLTHPAFIPFNSNGMWVGKFETGYNGAIDTESAQKNTQESDKIIIKPNVYSWRGIQIGNAFYASYNYIRELESHMMKNSEWGAIFYLTQSEYGLCTNGNCTEPRINNNGYYVTGYSANVSPTCGYTGDNVDCNKYESINLSNDGTYGYSYYNSKSVAASTTGNYYGVYDMAGGSWDYVMGVMQSTNVDNSAPASGRNSEYNSGFKGVYTCSTCDNQSAIELTNGLEWPPSMYYDLYQYYATDQQYQRGHLGDATKELGPFYSVKYNYGTKPTRYVSSYFADGSNFIYSNNPWFARGGHFTRGGETGIGTFYDSSGNSANGYSFRIVLML